MAQVLQRCLGSRVNGSPGQGDPRRAAVERGLGGGRAIVDGRGRTRARAPPTGPPAHPPTHPPTHLPMLMITPLRRAAIWGATTRIMRSAPSRLVPMIASTSSQGCSAAGPRRFTPARGVAGGGAGGGSALSTVRARAVGGGQRTRARPPALLMSTSIRPAARSTSPTAASADCWLVTSSSTASTPWAHRSCSAASFRAEANTLRAGAREGWRAGR